VLDAAPRDGGDAFRGGGDPGVTDADVDVAWLREMQKRQAS
jgi:hypothetical protein